MLTHVPALAATLAAASSSSSKASAGGSAFSLLFIVVLFAAGYFLFLRPRSQQAKRQREEMSQVEVGDEVLTGAGIFGTIVDIEGDRVLLETSPGTRVTVLRSTVARRLTEPQPEPASQAEEHDDWDDDDEPVTPGASDKRVHGSDDGHEGTGDGGARAGEGS